MKIRIRKLLPAFAVVVLMWIGFTTPPRISAISPPPMGMLEFTLCLTGQTPPDKVVADTAYEGSKSCKRCHLPTEKSWAETKHAHAMDVLKPGNNKDAKVKAKLDPEKDYTTDAKCLECHTVGFGKPGGYAVPDPSDEKAKKAAAKLENVGCEICHGPGSKYNELFEEIQKSKRKYKIEELYAAGLRKVEVTTCTTCHNERSPTHPPDPFDYEKMKEKGIHTHEQMKQREG